jgi:hypothetical protein
MMSIKPKITEPLVLKKYVFDPLSTIIKLAILGNKNSGAKISIKDNVIYIQEAGFIQSISRYCWGDTKTDLHYLITPIELACKIYLSTDIINRIPRITTLFKTARNGLDKLMNTYKQYPIIIHCLKYYQIIIDTQLNKLNEYNLIDLTNLINPTKQIETNPTNPPNPTNSKQTETNPPNPPNPPNHTKPITIEKNTYPTALQSTGICNTSNSYSGSPQTQYHTPNGNVSIMSTVFKKKTNSDQDNEKIADDLPVMNSKTIYDDKPKHIDTSCFKKTKKTENTEPEQTQMIKDTQVTNPKDTQVTNPKDTQVTNNKSTTEIDNIPAPIPDPIPKALPSQNNNSEEQINDITKRTISDLADLYDTKLLDKFDSVWTESKINIVIDMIEYLINENSPIDYAGCIETFMQPIDKEIVRIIYEK